MRIAQVAPLIEPVPPKTYGGTERIVSYITEELVKRGHEVTLFASADSQTGARLVSVSPKNLREERMENPGLIDPLAWNFIQLEKLLKLQTQFDVIHFHTDYLHFPVSRQSAYAHITTLHGRLDIAGLDLLYDHFDDIPVVSISDHQRLPIKKAFWIATVYHGLPADLYHEDSGKGNYLAFIGRISPEKRVDRAIEIAKRAGIPLKIAAKVDKADIEYFETEIRHLLDDPLIEFIGEIGENEKQEFLGNALAMLFPIDWPEPFGLVMIESMACGTPVIAFNKGSVPEVIDPGITGKLVVSIDEAVHAVKDIHLMSREKCRQKFEERFRVERMVSDYERVYEKVIEWKDKNPTHTPMHGMSIL